MSWQLSDAERRERFEKAWAAGDLVHILTQLWADQAVDFDGNALIGKLIYEKIRAVVKDGETAAALSPHDHPFGAKLALPRYQLLCDLQPSQRHAGEFAAGADQGHHRLRHRHRQAQRRCRRHRVRDRLRCHDRCDHGGASDHRTRRQVACRTSGRRDRRPISASPSRAFPTSS